MEAVKKGLLQGVKNSNLLGTVARNFSVSATNNKVSFFNV